jgi:hypothetical protein
MAALHPELTKSPMSSTPSAVPESYWADFAVTGDDLDFIYNLLLEREIPLTSHQMIESLVHHRLELLAREAERAEQPTVPIYVPAEIYEVGQQLAFEQNGSRIGTVIEIRQGLNPTHPPFQVIQVDFADGGESKEFAADFEDHLLNQVPDEPEPDDQPETPADVLARHAGSLSKRLESQLESTEEIVRIAGRWFHAALLADINEGHLNLAEAVLDVAEGGPLPTGELVEHIELPPGLDPLLTEFSVDFALQEDERFDEVGPAGKILWFLKRLEPPEVLDMPERLSYRARAYERESLTDEMLDLERRIDDELGDQQTVLTETADEATIPLLTPHWYAGTLPLSSKLRPLFPTAYEAPRIRFILVDGITGEQFPGWVVLQDRYVFGLREWYRRYDIPPGGLIRVRRGSMEGEVVVEPIDPRQRNDWIRTVALSEESQIGFTMLKHPVGSAYDDRMIVGIVDETALRDAWSADKQTKLGIDRVVPQVFRELSKLNPQVTVHAQELYSAMNVIRRIPPGPVFAELAEQPYFEHVGDHYWRLDESKWQAE